MEKQINIYCHLQKKIFVSYKELEGIPVKFNFKIFEIGNIIKKTIINSAQIKEKNKITDDKNINILDTWEEAKQQRFLQRYFTKNF